MAQEYSTGSLVSVEVKSAGTSIPGTYLVSAINIEHAINRVSIARIDILEGNAEAGFAVSDSATFVPGTEISIQAGYDGINSEIFQGIVTKQTIRVDGTHGSRLEVECRHKAVKMTVGRKCALFQNMTDSAAIAKLIAAAGVAARVTSTSTQQEQLVQYDTSDWDFMLDRAAANGMVVATLEGAVSVFRPDANTTSVLTLSHGDNLFELNAELNALSQFEKVRTTAWNYKEQKLSEAQAGNDTAGPGNLSGKSLAAALGLGELDMRSAAGLGSGELGDWAKARAKTGGLSKIVGTARFQGSALAVPGKYLTLAGVGDRFNGDHFIASARQTIADGAWITEVGLGLTPDCDARDNRAGTAAGLLPEAPGLFNATVKQIHEDPDNGYRVLVEVALFDTTGKGLWARLANIYATNGGGAFFLPEVGDEVILGFLNRDPRYPVVLGSLYGPRHKPEAAFMPNAKNDKKGIVSKSGLRLQYDDEGKVLTLATPGGNCLELDDQGERLKLKDKHGNALSMSANGIVIESTKDISVKVGETSSSLPTDAVSPSVASAASPNPPDSTPADGHPG